MLKKNSMLTGILLALILPAIALLAGYLLRNNEYIINKPTTPFFIAVMLNLLAIRYFRKDGELTGRGIMLVTFIIMILVFIFKAQHRLT